MKYLTVLLLPLLMACGSRNADSTMYEIEGEQLDIADASTAVAIEDVAFQMMPDGARILTGRFINMSEQDIGRAQLQVGLYDEHNRSIGMMLVVLDDVGANSEKTFREHVENDAEGARVRSVLMQ